MVIVLQNDSGHLSCWLICDQNIRLALKGASDHSLSRKIVYEINQRFTCRSGLGRHSSDDARGCICSRGLLRLSWLRVLRLLPELLRLRLGRLRSALGASLLWRVARARVGRRTRLARRRMARSSLTRSSATVPGVLRHSVHAGSDAARRLWFAQQENRRRVGKQ